MILHFNLVPSLKIWETFDMKVWLGNLTTQNLPDKSQIFQLLEKQGKYLCVHLVVLWQRSDGAFKIFSLNLYIGILYWRTLNNMALTGRLIANLQLHIHEHMFNRRRFMSTHMLSMCTYYTFLKPCYFTCKQTEVLCSKL